MMRQDQLVCVDEFDNPLYSLDKAACHVGQGTLHRAFSLFVVGKDGRILVQQRSRCKELWPSYWANSCCSHPRWGEEIDDAVRRRAREELGIEIESLKKVFSFKYRASFNGVGSEYELCHVFVSNISSEKIELNPMEVASICWLSADQIEGEIREFPKKWTPWMCLEWPIVSAYLAA